MGGLWICAFGVGVGYDLLRVCFVECLRLRFPLDLGSEHLFTVYGYRVPPCRYAFVSCSLIGAFWLTVCTCGVLRVLVGVQCYVGVDSLFCGCLGLL